MFWDRSEAGRRLAEKLEHLKGSDVVVLGLPRGGVPVAFEVAATLAAPLDVIVVLAEEADEVVCLETPTTFFAVGSWYADFSQTTDDEVVSLLRRAAAKSSPGSALSRTPNLQNKSR